MRSQFVAQLLLPIKIAIQEVEGDIVAYICSTSCLASTSVSATKSC